MSAPPPAYNDKSSGNPPQVVQPQTGYFPHPATRPSPHQVAVYRYIAILHAARAYS